jgi:hypothetical protein
MSSSYTFLFVIYEIASPVFANELKKSAAHAASASTKEEAKKKKFEDQRKRVKKKGAQTILREV